MNALILDEHQETLDETATALFSADRTYRYALTRRWDSDRPLAVWLMLNPSTADAFTADPTIRRCMSFAKSWQCGGILVLNLFGLRSTDPAALYSHADPVGPDNDRVIAEHLSGEPVGPVVCAWGVHGAHAERGQRIEGLLRARGAAPLCLGLTKDGYPRHPLYVSAAAATVEYRGGEQS